MNLITIFLIIILLIILVFVYVALKPKHQETFDNLEGDDESELISNFLKEYGFNNINEVKNFVHNNEYKENIKNLPSNELLTMYYSSFSTPPKDTTSWKGLKGKENMTFNVIPYVNPHSGIEMLSNRLIGPPTMSMGIKGNGSFSIFIFLCFKKLPKNKEHVFQMYANTVTNNALSLSVNEKGKLFVQFGSPKENSELICEDDLPINTPTLLCISKQADKLELWGPKDDVSSITLDIPDVLFSNKEMVINPSTNMSFNLYSFGVYNSYITEEPVLSSYLSKELSKMTQSFMSNAKQVLEFNEELAKTKKCPFDETVCKSCSEIKEWNNINDTLNKASEKCLNAIDDFCSKNTDHKHCQCWKPNASTSCKRLVSLYKQQHLVNPLEMSETDLVNVKKKFSLCDCSEKENLQNELLLLDQERKRNDLQLRQLNSDIRVIPEEYIEPPSYQSTKTLKSGFWSWLFGQS